MRKQRRRQARSLHGAGVRKKRDDGEEGRWRRGTREKGDEGGSNITSTARRPAARRRQHVHCNFYLVMKEGDEGEKEEAHQQHGSTALLPGDECPARTCGAARPSTRPAASPSGPLAQSEVIRAIEC